MCIDMYMKMCVHTCGGQKTSPLFSLKHNPACFIRHCLSGTLIPLLCTAREFPGSAMSTSEHWDMCVHYCISLMWVLRIRFRSPCLPGKHLTNWPVSTAPVYRFKPVTAATAMVNMDLKCVTEDQIFFSLILLKCFLCKSSLVWLCYLKGRHFRVTVFSVHHSFVNENFFWGITCFSRSPDSPERTHSKGWNHCMIRPLFHPSVL